MKGTVPACALRGYGSPAYSLFQAVSGGWLRSAPAGGGWNSAARLGFFFAPRPLPRANLISKGLIFAPEHGIVAFTVPGMADFIQRQPNP
jgi:hypothetical protein